MQGCVDESAQEKTDDDLALPWVSKICLGDNCIACDPAILVDDLQVMDATENEAKQMSQQAAALLNHLGIQDAPGRGRMDPKHL